MSLTDSRQTVRNSRFFKQMDEPHWQEIRSDFGYETWQKGRNALSQDISKTAYFVVSGHVKAVRINAETGRSVTLFLYGPGDVFDILQLLEDTCDDTLFEAYSDVSLLAAPQSEVRKWVRRYPEFNAAILPYLAKMIAHLEDMTSDLALHDTETRLAHLILRHLEENEQNFGHLIKNMSHENLAQMIGSVRAVVNRQLQHWRQDGIIATEKGKITVKNHKRLLEKVDSYLSS